MIEHPSKVLGRGVKLPLFFRFFDFDFGELLWDTFAKIPDLVASLRGQDGALDDSKDSLKGSSDGSWKFDDDGAGEGLPQYVEKSEDDPATSPPKYSSSDSVSEGPGGSSSNSSSNSDSSSSSRLGGSSSNSGVGSGLGGVGRVDGFGGGEAWQQLSSGDGLWGSGDGAVQARQDLFDELRVEELGGFNEVLAGGSLGADVVAPEGVIPSAKVEAEWSAQAGRFFDEVFGPLKTGDVSQVDVVGMQQRWSEFVRDVRQVAELGGVSPWAGLLFTHVVTGRDVDEVVDGWLAQRPGMVVSEADRLALRDTVVAQARAGLLARLVAGSGPVSLDRVVDAMPVRNSDRFRERIHEKLAELATSSTTTDETTTTTTDETTTTTAEETITDTSADTGKAVNVNVVSSPVLVDVSDTVELSELDAATSSKKAATATTPRLLQAQAVQVGSTSIVPVSSQPVSSISSGSSSQAFATDARSSVVDVVGLPIPAGWYLPGPGDSAQMRANAEALPRYRSNSGATEWMTVVAHGDPATGGIRVNDRVLDADGFAAWVKAQPGWNQRPLVLTICGAAVPGPNGTDSFAAQVRDELGVEVIAANGDVWTALNGMAYTGMAVDANGYPVMDFTGTHTWQYFPATAQTKPAPLHADLTTAMEQLRTTGTTTGHQTPKSTNPFDRPNPQTWTRWAGGEGGHPAGLRLELMARADGQVIAEFAPGGHAVTLLVEGPEGRPSPVVRSEDLSPLEDALVVVVDESVVAGASHVASAVALEESLRRLMQGLPELPAVMVVALRSAGIDYLAALQNLADDYPNTWIVAPTDEISVSDGQIVTGTDQAPMTWLEFRGGYPPESQIRGRFTQTDVSDLHEAATQDISARIVEMAQRIAALEGTLGKTPLDEFVRADIRWARDYLELAESASGPVGRLHWLHRTDAAFARAEARAAQIRPLPPQVAAASIPATLAEKDKSEVRREADGNPDSVSVNYDETIYHQITSGNDSYSEGQVVYAWTSSSKTNTVGVFLSAGSPELTTEFRDQVETTVAPDGVAVLMVRPGLGSRMLTAQELAETLEWLVRPDRTDPLTNPVEQQSPRVVVLAMDQSGFMMADALAEMSQLYPDTVFVAPEGSWSVTNDGLPYAGSEGQPEYWHVFHAGQELSYAMHGQLEPEQLTKLPDRLALQLTDDQIGTVKSEAVALSTSSLEDQVAQTPDSSQSSLWERLVRPVRDILPPLSFNGLGGFRYLYLEPLPGHSELTSIRARLNDSSIRAIPTYGHRQEAGDRIEVKISNRLIGSVVGLGASLWGGTVDFADAASAPWNLTVRPDAEYVLEVALPHPSATMDETGLTWAYGGTFHPSLRRLKEAWPVGQSKYFPVFVHSTKDVVGHDYRHGRVDTAGLIAARLRSNRKLWSGKQIVLVADSLYSATNVLARRLADLLQLKVLGAVGSVGVIGNDLIVSGAPAVFESANKLTISPVLARGRGWQYFEPSNDDFFGVERNVSSFGPELHGRDDQAFVVSSHGNQIQLLPTIDNREARRTSVSHHREPGRRFPATVQAQEFLSASIAVPGRRMILGNPVSVDNLSLVLAGVRSESIPGLYAIEVHGGTLGVGVTLGRVLQGSRQFDAATVADAIAVDPYWIGDDGGVRPELLLLICNPYSQLAGAVPFLPVAQLIADALVHRTGKAVTLLAAGGNVYHNMTADTWYVAVETSTSPSTGKVTMDPKHSAARFYRVYGRRVGDRLRMPEPVQKRFPQESKPKSKPWSETGTYHPVPAALEFPVSAGWQISDADVMATELVGPGRQYESDISRLAGLLSSYESSDRFHEQMSRAVYRYLRQYDQIAALTLYDVSKPGAKGLTTRTDFAAFEASLWRGLVRTAVAAVDALPRQQPQSPGTGWGYVTVSVARGANVYRQVRRWLAAPGPGPVRTVGWAQPGPNEVLVAISPELVRDVSALAPEGSTQPVGLANLLGADVVVRQVDQGDGTPPYFKVVPDIERAAASGYTLWLGSRGEQGSAAERAAVEVVPRAANMLTVASHFDSSGQRIQVGERFLTAGEFAAYLRTEYGWPESGGPDVLLVGCGAGRRPGSGQGSFAEQLRVELGVGVLASPAEVASMVDGRVLAVAPMVSAAGQIQVVPFVSAAPAVWQWYSSDGGEPVALESELAPSLQRLERIRGIEGVTTPPVAKPLTPVTWIREPSGSAALLPRNVPLTGRSLPTPPAPEYDQNSSTADQATSTSVDESEGPSTELSDPAWAAVVGASPEEVAKVREAVVAVPELLNNPADLFEITDWSKPLVVATKTLLAHFALSVESAGELLEELSTVPQTFLHTTRAFEIKLASGSLLGSESTRTVWVELVPRPTDNDVVQKELGHRLSHFQRAQESTSVSKAGKQPGSMMVSLPMEFAGIPLNVGGGVLSASQGHTASSATVVTDNYMLFGEDDSYLIESTIDIRMTVGRADELVPPEDGESTRTESAIKRFFRLTAGLGLMTPSREPEQTLDAAAAALLRPNLYPIQVVDDGEFAGNVLKLLGKQRVAEVGSTGRQEVRKVWSGPNLWRHLKGDQAPQIVLGPHRLGLPGYMAGVYASFRLVSIEQVGLVGKESWLRYQPTSAHDSGIDATTTTGSRFAALSGANFGLLSFLTGPTLQLGGSSTVTATMSALSRVTQETNRVAMGLYRTTYEVTLHRASYRSPLRFMTRKSPGAKPSTFQVKVVERAPINLVRAATARLGSPESPLSLPTPAVVEPVVTAVEPVVTAVEPVVTEIKAAVPETGQSNAIVGTPSIVRPDEMLIELLRDSADRTGGNRHLPRYMWQNGRLRPGQMVAHGLEFLTETIAKRIQQILALPDNRDNSEFLPVWDTSYMKKKIMRNVVQALENAGSLTAQTGTTRLAADLLTLTSDTLVVYLPHLGAASRHGLVLLLTAERVNAETGPEYLGSRSEPSTGNDENALRRTPMRFLRAIAKTHQHRSARSRTYGVSAHLTVGGNLPVVGRLRYTRRRAVGSVNMANETYLDGGDKRTDIFADRLRFKMELFALKEPTDWFRNTGNLIMDTAPQAAKLSTAVTLADSGRVVDLGQFEQSLAFTVSRDRTFDDSTEGTKSVNAIALEKLDAVAVDIDAELLADLRLTTEESQVTHWDHVYFLDGAEALRSAIVSALEEAREAMIKADPWRRFVASRGTKPGVGVPGSFGHLQLLQQINADRLAALLPSMSRQVIMLHNLGEVLGDESIVAGVFLRALVTEAKPGLEGIVQHDIEHGTSGSQGILSSHSRSINGDLFVGARAGGTTAPWLTMQGQGGLRQGTERQRGRQAIVTGEVERNETFSGERGVQLTVNATVQFIVHVVLIEQRDVGKDLVTRASRQVSGARLFGLMTSDLARRMSILDPTMPPTATEPTLVVPRMFNAKANLPLALPPTLVRPAANLGTGRPLNPPTLGNEVLKWLSKQSIPAQALGSATPLLRDNAANLVNIDTVLGHTTAEFLAAHWGELIDGGVSLMLEYPGVAGRQLVQLVIEVIAVDGLGEATEPQLTAVVPAPKTLEMNVTAVATKSRSESGTSRFDLSGTLQALGQGNDVVGGGEHTDRLGHASTVAATDSTSSRNYMVVDSGGAWARLAQTVTFRVTAYHQGKQLGAPLQETRDLNFDRVANHLLTTPSGQTPVELPAVPTLRPPSRTTSSNEELQTWQGESPVKLPVKYQPTDFRGAALVQAAVARTLGAASGDVDPFRLGGMLAHQIMAAFSQTTMWGSTRMRFARPYVVDLIEPSALGTRAKVTIYSRVVKSRLAVIAPPHLRDLRDGRVESSTKSTSVARIGFPVSAATLTGGDAATVSSDATQENQQVAGGTWGTMKIANVANNEGGVAVTGYGDTRGGAGESANSSVTTDVGVVNKLQPSAMVEWTEEIVVVAEVHHGVGKSTAESVLTIPDSTPVWMDLLDLAQHLTFAENEAAMALLARANAQAMTVTTRFQEWQAIDAELERNRVQDEIDRLRKRGDSQASSSRARKAPNWDELDSPKLASLSQQWRQAQQAWHQAKLALDATTRELAALIALVTQQVDQNREADLAVTSTVEAAVVDGQSEVNDQVEVEVEVEVNDQIEVEVEVEVNDQIEVEVEVEVNDQAEVEVDVNDQVEVEVEPNASVLPVEGQNDEEVDVKSETGVVGDVVQTETRAPVVDDDAVDALDAVVVEAGDTVIVEAGDTVIPPSLAEQARHGNAMLWQDGWEAGAPTERDGTQPGRRELAARAVPRAEGMLTVIAEFDSESQRIHIGGQLMSAREFAAHLRTAHGWPEAGGPDIVLVASDAGRSPRSTFWASGPSFARQLSAELGVGVLAPRGTVLTTRERTISGNPERSGGANGAAHFDIYSDASSGWKWYSPRGDVRRELGVELGEALGNVGKRVVPVRPPSEMRNFVWTYGGLRGGRSRPQQQDRVTSST
ncbi:hypothetical protein [Micromonospora sonneratiae]